MKKFLLAIVMATLLVGCFGDSDEVKNEDVVEIQKDETSKDEVAELPKDEPKEEVVEVHKEEPKQENVKEEGKKPQNATLSKENKFKGYKIIKVAGDNLSGVRKANVAVDIGYGSREYWAFTNKYGQLVKVTANKIIPQSDDEPVNSKGRYYDDEAKVPGTERKDLDEGHIIADSLGGVSNAYNITPQDSHLNRYGDQAYMEKVIRDAGGCTNFVAIITYPNTKTQIPSHYSYTYTINGRVIKDEFDNKNPEAKTQTAKKPSKNKNKKPAKKPSSNVVNKKPQSSKVWISATGSKYHSKPNCGRMNPNTAKQISLSDAKSKGLEACKKCY